MKNKKLGIVLIVALLVILLGGAAILYNRLSAEAEGENPFGVTQPAAAQEPTAAPTSAPEEPETTALTEPQPSAPAEPTESPAETPAPTPGPIPAPDFTVTDGEGNPVKLSDFRGKPVILNFWASWCPPCKSEMPDFDEAYAEYGEEIHFVMVNLTDGYQETVESAEEFIADSGYSFPVYYDTEMEAAIAYAATSIPVTYLIDRDGNLVGQARGAISGEALAQGIGILLS